MPKKLTKRAGAIFASTAAEGKWEWLEVTDGEGMFRKKASEIAFSEKERKRIEKERIEKEVEARVNRELQGGGEGS